MKIFAISRRDQRALTLGVMTIAAATLLFRGAPALLRWTRAQQQVARRTAMDVAESRQLINAASWIRDSARVRSHRLTGLDSVFLADTTPSLAAAALVSELSNDADQTGVAIAVVQAEPIVPTDSILQRVRARLTVSGDFAAAMRFLAFIEARTPLLVVRELTMAHRELPVPGRSANLRADLVIEGFMKPPMLSRVAHE